MKPGEFKSEQKACQAAIEIGIFLEYDPSIDWFKDRSNIQWVVTNIPGSELKEGSDDFDRENDRIFMKFGEPKYKSETGL